MPPSDCITIPRLPSYLHDHPDRVRVENLLTGLTQGFRIGFQGPRTPKEYSNLLSARDNPSIISKNILKEEKLGHTAGPFITPSFLNFQVYPIGVIPKKHSSDWCTILDLSYPKHHSTSLNGMSPSDYSLYYITVNNAILVIQKLSQKRFMSKQDIKSSFRNIPVHPSDWELLGMKWQGMYHFDTVLPFGFSWIPTKWKPASHWRSDKLTRTKEALHEWSHNKSATLKELQSLIGTFQFACRVVVQGRAFLQCIISLTKGISNTSNLLNTEFRKDVSMWLASLEHWNGVNFFLGDTVLSSPELQLNHFKQLNLT